MDRDHALYVLGLENANDTQQIHNAYERKRSELTERLLRAPTDALRRKYQEALGEVVAASEVLKAVGDPVAQSATEPGYVRSPPPLTGTQIGDLPGAAPAYTQHGIDGGTATMGLRAGDVLAERYEIRRMIGGGGMGVVYEALDRLKQEPAAIKVLRPELLSNERAKERFLNEARVACRLSHSNIVRVFDVGVSGRWHFITMELLEGQTLRQRIDAMKLARTPLPVPQVVEYATQLIDALDYAHKSLVHRDLKPENVWLTEDGQLKLMDFGIARAVSQTELTRTGMALGTAYYMAPEQLAGLKDIDARADQYSLGVMLYEMLTGEIPQGAVQPPKALRKEIPSRLSAAIMRAISTRPDARFATLQELRKRLVSATNASRAKWMKALTIVVSVPAALFWLITLGAAEWPGAVRSVGFLLLIGAVTLPLYARRLPQLPRRIAISSARVVALLTFLLVSVAVPSVWTTYFRDATDRTYLWMLTKEIPHAIVSGSFHLNAARLRFSTEQIAALQKAFEAIEPSVADVPADYKSFADKKQRTFGVIGRHIVETSRATSYVPEKLGSYSESRAPLHRAWCHQSVLEMLVSNAFFEKRRQELGPDRWRKVAIWREMEPFFGAKGIDRDFYRTYGFDRPACNREFGYQVLPE